MILEAPRHAPRRPRPVAPPASLLVLHCPAGGGHKAAARAIAEVAGARGIACEVVDALELTPAWFARAYVGAHHSSTAHPPPVYGLGYAARDQRNPVADGLRQAFDRAAGARLRRFVASRAPTAVIATHFFPLSVLGQARLRRRLRVPLVGVVTDYAAHAFWAEPGVDRFCTPAGRAARDLVRHGVAPERIVATGIPVRPAFGRIPALVAPAPDEPLRVLVTSGGFGVGPMVEVIRSFPANAPVELTVVCGDNAARVAEARRAAALAGVRAEVVGFEPDMPRRVAAAHVIVGKPGGLTTSECLAAGRPMIIAGACPGQEARNERWMVEAGAALAAAPWAAGGVALSLRSQGRLEAMAEAARAAAPPRPPQPVVAVAQRLAGVDLRFAA